MRPIPLRRMIRGRRTEGRTEERTEEQDSSGQTRDSRTACGCPVRNCHMLDWNRARMGQRGADKRGTMTIRNDTDIDERCKARGRSRNRSPRLPSPIRPAEASQRAVQSSSTPIAHSLSRAPTPSEMMVTYDNRGPGQCRKAPCLSGPHTVHMYTRLGIASFVPLSLFFRPLLVCVPRSHDY